MKYIALTFDDGRSDNFLLAKKIMDKYGLTGTVFITTGFIDGTWENSAVLKSPSRPLHIDEILALKHSGWEIGLHGDKHLTCEEDMGVALEKLRSWGVENAWWGVSVPNSKAEETEVSRIMTGAYGNRVAYIRRGRKCDTTKFFNRLLYLLYSITGARWAYHWFNAANVFDGITADRSYIPSIVIKGNDRPEMITDFIRNLPDGSVVVCMLHSILSAEHPLNGKDPWSWEERKFEKFCIGLHCMIQEGTAISASLIDILGKDNTGILETWNELRTK